MHLPHRLIDAILPNVKPLIRCPRFAHRQRTQRLDKLALLLHPGGSTVLDDPPLLIIGDWLCTFSHGVCCLYDSAPSSGLFVADEAAELHTANKRTLLACRKSCGEVMISLNNAATSLQ